MLFRVAIAKGHYLKHGVTCQHDGLTKYPRPKEEVMMKASLASALGCVLLGLTGTVAGAAEIKFLCPVAMTAVMSELIPQFERASSHKVTVEYATVGVITDRVLKGDAADVAVVSKQQAADLQKKGKIVAGSGVDIARVGYGVFVREGTRKVDIQSVDAFKRSLLAAKSITYVDPATGAPSGIYAARLMERLGVAAEVKPKTKLVKPGVEALEPVAKGDAEIGLGPTIAAVPGVELVGPLPADIQSYTEFAAGLLVASKEAEAGKALVALLTSPAGQSILRSKGFEPR
jgi:molybdate transport system substrate-binding protein